jgi:serine protease
MDKNPEFTKNDLIHRGLRTRPVIGGRNIIERPSGMVIIRLVSEFRDKLVEKTYETLDDFAKTFELKGLMRVLEQNKWPKALRLTKSIPASKIADLERRASNSRFAPIHSLNQYWRFDLRELTKTQIQQALTILNDLQEVDQAWLEPVYILPAVNAANDPYNINQGYQDSAPDGIDARWMWTQSSGEGAGVGVMDVEGGWRITHEDLVAKAPTLIHGTQYASWVDHGTAVLGEITASDNTVGVVGSAPSITSIRMSSIYDAMGIQHTTDALVAAIMAMSAGEILLTELQTSSYTPIETSDANLDAIRLASAIGIIVVEAAGNGDTDLDAWVTPGGLHRLNRSSVDFVDSGAIMVGAAISTVPHDRWAYSNYGSRIDCFGWGENVTSTGYGDLDDGGGNPDMEYTNTFQGTSSASPIIVSAAALLQSRYMSISGSYLSPMQMRLLLSDPATGTAQGGGVIGAIGVMPNLALIVPLLGLLPDVYVRDAVGDTGVIPWTGPLSVSPDVIILPNPVIDPQASFGEGSGTENDTLLGEKVELGQDNTVYIRMRNRGGVAATNLTVTVYWAYSATLLTPSSWTLVGSTTVPNVPIGDILTVSPAITWQKANLPTVPHACFIVVLSHPLDPAPITPGPLQWDDFCKMIQNNNNVTWDNFNMVEELDDPPSFIFNLTGADDKTLLFEFEIERRLPIDARLEFKGPLGIIHSLRGENQWKIIQGKRRDENQLLLPALPRIKFNKIRIPKGTRLQCELKVIPGKSKILQGHGIAIRQLYEKQEVGRVQWQFVERKEKKTDIKKVK